MYKYTEDDHRHMAMESVVRQEIDHAVAMRDRIEHSLVDPLGFDSSFSLKMQAIIEGDYAPHKIIDAILALAKEVEQIKNRQEMIRLRQDISIKVSRILVRREPEWHEAVTNGWW